MTQEKNQEFNSKLTALLKEYNVNIVPHVGLQLQDVVQQEEAKEVEEEVLEEVLK